MAVDPVKLCKDCAFCAMPPALPVLAALTLAIATKRDDFSNAVCIHPSSPVDPIAGNQKLQCMLHRLKANGPYCCTSGKWHKPKTSGQSTVQAQ